MNEWGVFLTLGAITGTFLTFYKFFKGIEDTIADKSEESMKATQENTKQLILFNANLEHMRDRDNNRDKRLDRHSEKLDDHNDRITKLESTNFVKYYEDK